MPSSRCLAIELFAPSLLLPPILVFVVAIKQQVDTTDFLDCLDNNYTVPNEIIPLLMRHHASACGSARSVAIRLSRDALDEQNDNEGKKVPGNVAR